MAGKRAEDLSVVQALQGVLFIQESDECQLAQL
jgi:hypothetical protein